MVTVLANFTRDFPSCSSIAALEMCEIAQIFYGFTLRFCTFVSEIPCILLGLDGHP